MLTPDSSFLDEKVQLSLQKSYQIQSQLRINLSAGNQPMLTSRRRTQIVVKKPTAKSKQVNNTLLSEVFGKVKIMNKLKEFLGDSFNPHRMLILKNKEDQNSFL